MSLKRYLDERQQAKPKRPDNIKQRDISDEEITQYTDLEFSFELSGKTRPLKIPKWTKTSNAYVNRNYFLLHRNIHKNIQRLRAIDITDRDIVDRDTNRRVCISDRHNINTRFNIRIRNDRFAKTTIVQSETIGNGCRSTNIRHESVHEVCHFYFSTYLMRNITL